MTRRELNVIGWRRLWYLISGCLFAASLIALGFWGLKLGIDFTGGSLIEIQFQNERPSVTDISAALPETFGNVFVAPLGDKGVMLRLRSVTEIEHQELLKTLRDKFTPGEESTSLREERFTSIGPTIGTELSQKAIWSIALVLLAIVSYIAWAFRQVTRPVPSWLFGLAAIVALFHDVIIPVGIFSALGHFKGVEIDTLFITAILTVLGFSVHDTIVVFDRIRENLLRHNENFITLVNNSINQTIARSINTSMTTLLVLITTYIFGGESIRYFILTLIIGIIFGTYSSIFIASPLLVSVFRWREQRRNK